MQSAVEHAPMRRDQLWSMRLPTDDVPTLPEPLGPCVEPPLKGAAGKLPGRVPLDAAGAEGTDRLATCSASGGHSVAFSRVRYQHNG